MQTARGDFIQAFVADPNKSQVPINMAQAGPVSAAGTRIFKKGPGGDYNITGWLAISLAPTSIDIVRYFNANTTKTKTVPATQDNIILIHDDVLQIVIIGTDIKVEVEGA